MWEEDQRRVKIVSNMTGNRYNLACKIKCIAFCQNLIVSTMIL